MAPPCNKRGRGGVDTRGPTREVDSMAATHAGAPRRPRVDYRPWDLDDRTLFPLADLHGLKPGQRRLCEQMGAVIVDPTDGLVVAIGVRYGRWIALRWTKGRLNGLAFST